MRIQLASDLHFELCSSFTLPQTDAEVLVLAGDIHRAAFAPETASVLAGGKPCVLVAGNHEFYRSSMPEGLFEIEERASEYPNVHFLENQAVEIDSVVFLGCVLWSDMRLFAPEVGYQVQVETVQNSLNDYRQIQWCCRRPLQAADTITMHHESIDWLRRQFAAHAGKKIVVVTHHAPSMSSIAPRYRHDIVSAGFASGLDELVEASGAVLWIHGHSHGCCDYQIGRTRVVSNCLGYSFEQTGFDPALVIKI